MLLLGNRNCSNANFALYINENERNLLGQKVVALCPENLNRINIRFTKG